MRYPLILALGLGLFASACATANKKADVTEIRASAFNSYISGDHDTAMKLYRDLLQKAPGDADAWFRIGNIYANRQDAENAISAYDKSLALKPELAPAWRNLAIMRLRQARQALYNSQDNLPDDDPLKENNQKII